MTPEAARKIFGRMSKQELCGQLALHITEAARLRRALEDIADLINTRSPELANEILAKAAIRI